MYESHEIEKIEHHLSEDSEQQLLVLLRKDGERVVFRGLPSIDAYQDRYAVVVTAPPYGAKGDCLTISDVTNTSGSSVVNSQTVVPETCTPGKVAVLGKAKMVLQVHDAVMSKTDPRYSKRLTSATGGFTSSMEGRSILIDGANTGGLTLSTTVIYVQDSNTLWTSTACLTSVSGVTATINKSLVTEIVSVAPNSLLGGFDITLADLVELTATNAGMTYGTDDSDAFAAASLVSPSLILPPRPYMLANPSALNGPIILKGYGWAPSSNTAGTRLYLPNGGPVINSNGVNSNVHLEHLTFDALNSGDYAVTLGNVGAGNKTANVTTKNVDFRRAVLASMRMISAGACLFEHTLFQNCIGGAGILSDAVTGSGLNTDLTFVACVMAGNGKGLYAKDLRSTTFLHCNFNSNYKEAVLLEQQNNNAYSIRDVAFRDCGHEGNFVSPGYQGAGRGHIKATSLSPTLQAKATWDGGRVSGSGGDVAGDYLMQLDGGDYELRRFRPVQNGTSQVYRFSAGAAGAATAVTEHTTDFLTPTANLTGVGGALFHSIGAGVKATLHRTGGVGDEIWIADGAGYARKFVLTSASPTV